MSAITANALPDIPSVTTPDSTSVTEPTAVPAEPKAKPTYQVYSVDSNGVLTPVSARPVEASNDIEAIRSVASQSDAGQFTAISPRYLKVRTVSVENTPRVVIS